MARESQAYQIAVIIFFITTILLAVTTFLFFKQAQDEKVEAEKAADTAREEEGTRRVFQQKAERMKELMGFPLEMDVTKDGEDPAAPASIEGFFNQDMASYAGGVHTAKLNYHGVLPELRRMIDERNARIQTLQSQLDELAANYKVRFEGSDAAQVVFTDTLAQLKTDNEKIRTDYENTIGVIKQEQGGHQTRWNDSINKSDAEKSTIQEALATAVKELGRERTKRQEENRKQRKTQEGTFEVPDGEIRWVSQRDGVVWINLGRADLLRPQITFSVYPANTTNLLGAAKKASIEVTRIRGDSVAEARIVEDVISDPILVGDKIHTPVWSPGEQTHFALSGTIDIDGDGVSDVNTVRNLITMNGAIVDCWIDEAGVRHGDISLDTDYLIRGAEPNLKSQAFTAYSQMNGKAEENGVKAISVEDLLRRMGWRNQTPVIRYGAGANPRDFQPKPADGVVRESTGDVSGLFQPRQPPASKASGRGSAYPTPSPR